MIYRFLTLFLLVVCFSQLVSAQADQEGFQHVLLASSAAYSGSGESNSGLLTGSETVFLHGWMSANAKKNEDVQFSHTGLFDGITQTTLTSRLLLWEHPVQLGWQYVTAGDIEYREKPGPAASTFQVYWLTVAAGSQIRLNGHDLAFTLKYSFQNLFFDRYDAWLTDWTWSHQAARDVGLMLVSLQNIGVVSSGPSVKGQAPVRLRTAWQFYDWDLSEQIRLQIVSELNYGFITRLITPTVGIESTLYSQVRFRMGVRPTHTTNPFSSGLSVYHKSFRVDYAFNYQESGFTSTHGITVGYQF
ncbi:MAG: hypothetical protein HUU10_01105 [Bacteroidetes bacterium]|nr:hypothetical protein [Bacteroidota bacterium]